MPTSQPLLCSEGSNQTTQSCPLLFSSIYRVEKIYSKSRSQDKDFRGLRLVVLDFMHVFQTLVIFSNALMACGTDSCVVGISH